MMKTIVLDGIKYQVQTDYKNGYDADEITRLYTDYFKIYDYILGDWSYGKLRLKGFCKKENKHYNHHNADESYRQYLKDYCAYDCRYCYLEKIND